MPSDNTFNFLDSRNRITAYDFGRDVRMKGTTRNLDARFNRASVRTPSLKDTKSVLEVPERPTAECEFGSR